MDPKLVLTLTALGIVVAIAIFRSEFWRMKPDRHGRLFVDRGRITHQDFATMQDRYPEREFRQIDIVLTCGPAAQERTLLLWRLAGPEPLSEPVHMAFFVSITLQDDDVEQSINAILLPRYKDGWNCASELREIVAAF